MVETLWTQERKTREFEKKSPGLVKKAETVGGVAKGAEMDRQEPSQERLVASLG